MKLIYTIINKFRYKMGLVLNNYKCGCCGNRIPWYKPLPQRYFINAKRYGYQFFGRGEMTNLKTYSCPNCGANDRDRLISLYFRDIAFEGSLYVLDIAPSPSLGKFLDGIELLKRRTCDLNMEHVDDKANIEQLDIYSDNTFDAIICSHVLEHVNNPSHALTELYRVLKPGGFAILMVPICMDISNTIEDRSHSTAELRWQHYGQGDHLRLFSRKGFISIIESGGFKVQLLSIDQFGRKVFRQNGLKRTSTLYIGLKNTFIR